MTWAFRTAGIDEAAVLAAFWRDRFVETFGTLYRPQDLAAFISQSYALEAMRAQLADPHQEMRVAQDRDGAIQGAAHIGPMKLPVPGASAPEAFELFRLYLTPEAKGRGLADALMLWALDEARGRGASEMYLGVFSENARAIAFYMRHGFEKVGEYEFPVGEARDREWILRRPL